MIERSGHAPEDCDLAVRDVADEHWHERYQAGLRPFAFASRFVVCPSGELPAGDLDETSIMRLATQSWSVA